MLYEYLEKQRLSFGEDAMTVILLGITAAMYPLLGEEGIYLDAPLAVIVEEESQIMGIAKIVSGFAEMEVLSLNDKPKKVKTKIEHVEYGIAIFNFIEGRYTKDNLEIICSDCANIEANINNRKLVVVLAEGGISYEHRENFSGYLYIKAKLPLTGISQEENTRFLKKLIKMILENEKVIRYEIGKIPPIEEDGLAVFYAACVVLLVLLEFEKIGDDGYKKYMEIFLRIFGEIKDSWQQTDDPEEYAEFFFRLLDEAVGWLPPMEERGHISGETAKKWEQIPLYDEKYYYISQSLFEEICRPFTSQVSIKHVKRQLAAAGVLAADMGGLRIYGTAQVETTNVYGARIRKRYVRLCRNKVDKEGELSFGEKLSKEEKE